MGKIQPTGLKATSDPIKIAQATLDLANRANVDNMPMQSVYLTKYFKIHFNKKEEDDLYDKGYHYGKRQFSDADYPQIQYGKNFFVTLSGRRLTLEEYQQRYPRQKQVNDMVSIRVKELGMLLDSACETYSSLFRKINTPYDIYMVSGESGYYNKLTGAITLPIQMMDTPQGIKVLAGHELFHVFQNKYANVVDMAKNKWLLEATAEYAAHRIPYGAIPFTVTPNRTVNMKYFQTALGTLNPFLSSFPVIGDFITLEDHEYKSGQFIEYLINRHSLDLPGMFENFSSQAFVGDFGFLDAYLKTKNPNFTLGKAYLDFAGYMMLDANGSFGQKDMFPEATFKLPFSGDRVHYDINRWPDQVYIPYLAASKIEIPEKEKRTVKITAKSPALGFGVNVYQLKGNVKRPGLKPVLELGTEAEKSTIVEVEKGDVIYFVAGNSALDDPSGTKYPIKGSVSIEDISIRFKTEDLLSTRTRRTVKITPEGKGLEDLSILDFKWTVTTDKDDYIDLTDPTVATFSGPSMQLNMIHKNPIDDPANAPLTGGSTNPFGSSDPFDIIIMNIDDGTEYTIGLKITNKKTGAVVSHSFITLKVGVKSPMKQVPVPPSFQPYP